jgi:hypothetical protein
LQRKIATLAVGCASHSVQSQRKPRRSVSFVRFFGTPAALRLAHHYHQEMRVLNTRLLKCSASLDDNDVLQLFAKQQTNRNQKQKTSYKYNTQTDNSLHLEISDTFPNQFLEQADREQSRISPISVPYISAV